MMVQRSDFETEEILIDTGRKSQQALRTIDPILEDAEDRIVNTLAMSGHKLTDLELRLMVGELVGLRKIRLQLSSKVTAGKNAEERLNGK
jgi:hypothetical protein